MNDASAARATDRRRFLMLMGLACASTAIARPAAAIAPPASPPAPAVPAPASGAAPPSAEALALAEVVRVRFGGSLTPAQLGAIAADLDGRLDDGRELRKLKLENGVDPDTTFHA